MANKDKDYTTFVKTIKNHNAKKVLKTTLMFFSCAMQEEFLYVMSVQYTLQHTPYLGLKRVGKLLLNYNAKGVSCFGKCLTAPKYADTHTHTQYEQTIDNGNRSTIRCVYMVQFECVAGINICVELIVQLFATFCKTKCLHNVYCRRCCGQMP